MDEEHYQALCQACDEILLEARENPECLANAWLHVIREHPVFLRCYERVFAEPAVTGRLQWLGLRRALVEVLRALRQLIRALRNSLSLREAFPRNLSPVDVLFISHLVNDRQRDADDDFYFGSLPANLAAQGKKVAIALIDHTQASSVRISLLPSRAEGVTRLLLANTIGLGAELGLFKKMWQHSGHLLRQPSGGALGSRVKVAAAAEALSNATFHSYRIAYQACALIARMHPSTLITTFEGHAWERVTYALSRQTAPELRCAGYLHAALFRLQHSVRRSLQGSGDPDVIFTSGPAGKRQLDIMSKGVGAPVQVLGSIRAGGLGTLPDMDARIRCHQEPVCLVIPEGLESEALLLFEYSLHCAKVMPKVTFLWRLHPVISFEDLLKRNPELASLPPNVELSKGGLEADAARARWALYRGSTAIIPVALAGAAPVYLARMSEMTIDPLYELNDERAIVFTAQDMVSLVQGHDSQYPTEEQVRAVALHCLEIFSPVSPEVLTDYVGCRNDSKQVGHVSS